MPPASLKNDNNNSFQDKPKVAPAPHMLSALLPLYQLLPLSVAELIIKIIFLVIMNLVNWSNHA